MRLIGLAVVFALSLVPLATKAQQVGRTPHVGFLTGPTGTGTTFFDAFRQGLEELGWKEGQNIALEVSAFPIGTDTAGRRRTGPNPRRHRADSHSDPTR
jgi:hypothetical protein